MSIINGAAYLIFSRKAKNQKNIQGTPSKIYAILIIAVYAILAGISFLCMLIAAKTLPAVILYPSVTGGSIVLSTVGARIFFKEKISMPALAGIIMSIVGILLFLIKIG